MSNKLAVISNALRCNDLFCILQEKVCVYPSLFRLHGKQLLFALAYLYHVAEPNDHSWDGKHPTPGL